MVKLKWFLPLALACVVLIGTTSFAQEQISGNLSGTLGPGTYLVVGDIRVMPADVLEILPGTEFLHNGNWTWEIYGQLNANGAEGDSINFVRQNPISDHRWGGIRFMSGASDASTIDYCVIDYCYHGVQPYYTYGTGIYTDGIAITVSNTRVSNCSNYWDGGGIYANGADITVTNCLIVANTAASGSNGGGIYLNSCENAEITYNVVVSNSATGT